MVRLSKSFFATLVLGLGDLALCDGRLEIGLGLGQVVARRALVDQHQQRAGLHDLARLALGLEDFAGGLRLDLDREQGLDAARRLHRDRDVAPPDRFRVVLRLGSLPAAAAESGQQRWQERR